MPVIGPLIEIKPHFIGRVISRSIFYWLLWNHTRWIPNSSSVSVILTVNDSFRCSLTSLCQLYQTRCCSVLCVQFNLRHGLIQAVQKDDNKTFCFYFLSLWLNIQLSLVSPYWRFMAAMLVVSDRLGDKARHFEQKSELDWVTVSEFSTTASIFLSSLRSKAPDWTCGRFT